MRTRQVEIHPDALAEAKPQLFGTPNEAHALLPPSLKRSITQSKLSECSETLADL